MTETGVPAALRTWLGELSAALAKLPPAEREAIVSEARSHLIERLSGSALPADALGELGEAAEFAKGFLAQHELGRAVSSRSMLASAKALRAAAGRSVRAAVGLLLALPLGALFLASLACIAVKLVRPDLVGLWLDLPLGTPHRYESTGASLPLPQIGHDHVIFGLSSPPPAMPEYLGGWIFPILIALAILSLLALRGSLLAAARNVRKNWPASPLGALAGNGR